MRITKAFINARLETTTSLMREAGSLGETEVLDWESTGSDRYPYSLVIVEVTDTSIRIIKQLTTALTWHGLNAAVDTSYELAWHNKGRN